jgi:uncharacterized C2H2 Zn-finger protein
MSQTGPEYAQANGCPGFWDGSSSDALHSRGYVGVEPYQQDFLSAENSLVIASLLVPGTRVEQNPIASFHLPLDVSSAHNLTTSFSPDVNEFHQTGATTIGRAHDWMQHRLNVPDAQQLANLPEHQLESIAKDVAHALVLVKQKKIKGSPKPVEAGSRVQTINKPDKVEEEPQNKTKVFKCEYSGCNTTFRRNKDRTRHVFNKHQGNSGFACPIIDCPMGTGHTVERSDKLRDHLRGKAASSRTWRCVLPGCSATGVNKTWWFNHVKQHDQETRVANRHLLTSYGYKEHYGPCLTVGQLCSRRGCPFGTKSSADMDQHLLIPHEGPEGLHFPCPIPDCQTGWKDWEAVAQHLASGHTRAARQPLEQVLGAQGFDYWETSFTCPIPVCHRVFKRSYWVADMERKAREHCLEHEFATLLSTAESLVNAWRLAFEGYNLYSNPFKFAINTWSLSNNLVFAFLALPSALLLEARTPEDVDRLLLERGINLP